MEDINSSASFFDNQGVILRTKEPNTPRPGQWLFNQVDSVILELPASLKVTFVWCPGHRDILGNEMEDQLEKNVLDFPSTPSLEIKSNYKKVHCEAVEEGLLSKMATPSFL
jgi:hypothetical protein